MLFTTMHFTNLRYMSSAHLRYKWRAPKIKANGSIGTSSVYSPMPNDSLVLISTHQGHQAFYQRKHLGTSTVPGIVRYESDLWPMAVKFVLGELRRFSSWQPFLNPLKSIAQDFTSPNAFNHATIHLDSWPWGVWVQKQLYDSGPCDCNLMQKGDHGISMDILGIYPPTPADARGST